MWRDGHSGVTRVTLDRAIFISLYLRSMNLTLIEDSKISRHMCVSASGQPLPRVTYSVARTNPFAPLYAFESRREDRFDDPRTKILCADEIGDRWTLARRADSTTYRSLRARIARNGRIGGAREFRIDADNYLGAIFLRYRLGSIEISSIV